MIYSNLCLEEGFEIPLSCGSMPWCPFLNTVCGSGYKPGIYVTGQVFRALWCIIPACVLCVRFTVINLCKLTHIL